MKYKRVVITRRGGPEVLQLVEDALREPAPGEVRVRTLSKGQLHPVVAQRFPLSEAGRAHEVLAAGSTTGKLVLTLE